MKNIDLKWVALAFLAELGLDAVIGTLLLAFMGREVFVAGMSGEEVEAATKALTASTDYLLASMVFGTATTVAGGFLAARLAKTFPYYNGLGIGLLGLTFGMLFWGQSPLWYSAFGVLVTVPASIYGAHLAKKSMM